MQTAGQEITVLTAQGLGLTDREFARINQLLGRAPNQVELGLYAALWSDDFCQKNSIKWLKTLPTETKDNKEPKSGWLDLGDGIVCSLHIETLVPAKDKAAPPQLSSLIYNVKKSVAAHGAFPVAVLGALLLGNTESKQGIALYQAFRDEMDTGQRLVGGQVFYQINQPFSPIMQAVALGIANSGDTVPSTASTPGNSILLVTTNENTEANETSTGDFLPENFSKTIRQAVQTGVVTGMTATDVFGVAGAAAKMCSKPGIGMALHIEKMPVMQSNADPLATILFPFEAGVLMEVVKGEEQTIFQVFDKQGFGCDQIGHVSDTGNLVFYLSGNHEAEVPVRSFLPGSGAPSYDREANKPKHINQGKQFNLGQVKPPGSFLEAAKTLFASPNLVAKRCFFSKNENSVISQSPEKTAVADATVVPVDGWTKSAVLAISGNPAYTWADPYIGAMIEVASAARRITASGGVPMALTFSLHAGPAQHTEQQYFFTNTVRGIGEACRKFGIKLMGNRVRFQESDQQGQKTAHVFPNLLIGMVGVLEAPSHHVPMAFQQEGDCIYLIGSMANDLGSSEYLRHVVKAQHSPAPEFDLHEELELQKHLKKLIRKGIVRSAHMVGEGGLFTSLMESALVGQKGFSIEIIDTFRKECFLFGENQSRSVLTTSPKQEDELQNYLINSNVSFTKLGEVFGKAIVIDNENFGSITDWNKMHKDTLGQLSGHESG